MIQIENIIYIIYPLPLTTTDCNDTLLKVSVCITHHIKWFYDLPDKSYVLYQQYFQMRNMYKNDEKKKIRKHKFIFHVSNLNSV